MRKRVDDNQTQVVKALREAGCAVQSLASVGNGCPDLLVSRNGWMWLLEVKNDARSPSRRRLTDDEREWRLRWKAPVFVVESVAEALGVIMK